MPRRISGSDIYANAASQQIASNRQIYEKGSSTKRQLVLLNERSSIQIPRGIMQIQIVTKPTTSSSCHRYCTFCPPLFSNFFCLLLSPAASPVPSPWPVIPAIPCLIFINMLDAIHIEYIGTTAYMIHALFPKSAAAATHAHVQYNTSHINSVKPFASISSPDRLSSPLSAYDGRPIFSNQNSMPSAGAENKT